MQAQPYSAHPTPSPAASTTQGRDARSPAARYGTLGATCIALGVAEILASAQRMGATAFSGAIQGAFAPAYSSPMFTGDTKAITAAAAAFGARIAPWEIGRATPFLVASGILVWVGVRLRRGDASALVVARRWTLGAIVVLAASILVQALVTVPMTLAYQRALVDVMMKTPATGQAPFDVKEFTGEIAIAATVAGVVAGAVVLAVWPIVLFFWSGRLLRQAPR